MKGEQDRCFGESSQGPKRFYNFLGSGMGGMDLGSPVSKLKEETE